MSVRRVKGETRVVAPISSPRHQMGDADASAHVISGSKETISELTQNDVLKTHEISGLKETDSELWN